MPLRKIKLFMILIAGTLLSIAASIFSISTYRQHTGPSHVISNTSGAIGILHFPLIYDGLKRIQTDIPWLRTQYAADDKDGRKALKADDKDIHEVLKVNMSSDLLIVTDTFKISKQRHEHYSNLEMTALILGKERAHDFHVFDNSTGNSTIPGAFRPRTYSYILNNETVCSRGEMLGYILCIYSSPAHFYERREIRKYWGQANLFPSFPSATLFFLGAVGNPTLQLEIDQESSRYGDIIQANFIDSYKNLSLKGITMLHWLDEYCKNSKYILKTDDDIYTDMFQVAKVLKSVQETTMQKYIIGTVIERNVIVRDVFFEPKWVVEKDLFPRQLIYPPYYHGWAYILSSDIIHDMYEAAVTTPVFYIDDVYISGLLTSQITGITYMNFEASVPYEAYIPTYPALAKEWGPEKIAALWCKQLQSLSDEDKGIIGEERLKELYRVQCPLRARRLVLPQRGSGIRERKTEGSHDEINVVRLQNEGPTQ